jgi:hypothetical protein
MGGIGYKRPPGNHAVKELRLLTNSSYKKLRPANSHVSEDGRRFPDTSEAFR